MDRKQALLQLSELLTRDDIAERIQHCHDYQIPIIYFADPYTYEYIKPILQENFPGIYWKITATGIIPSMIYEKNPWIPIILALLLLAFLTIME